MFKLPTLQGTYTLCSIHDAALELPTAPTIDRATASAEEIAAADAVLEERHRKYQRAVETGKWPAITRAGDSPTTFEFENINGAAFTWWQGEVSRHRLSRDEGFELAFRLALRSIGNTGRPIDLKYEKREGRSLVTEQSIAPLYEIGRDTGEPQLGRLIVLELGALVLTRAVQGVPPLS